MNLTPTPRNPAADLQNRRALTTLLDSTIASLELTSVQRETIGDIYNECATHLVKALGYAIDQGEIFPQGSLPLGTVIRPLGRITEIFDLDLVFRIFAPSSVNDPKRFRDMVGDHLRVKYNGSVKPLPKGWRLDFGGKHDCYLDLIPAMNSPRSPEIIAITAGSNWKDSHPRGYAAWFEAIAAQLPEYGTQTVFNRENALANSVTVEPLPEYTPFKSPLKRIVQISKRYRDYYFNLKVKQPDFAPSSIILTTLLAEAYFVCRKRGPYSTDFDLLLACVEEMPNHFAIVEDAKGLPRRSLTNPSLPSENLLASWTDPKHDRYFDGWHRDFLGFLRTISTPQAPQRQLLTEAMGLEPVNKAYARHLDILNAARERDALRVAPAAGLTLGAGLAVPRRPFHGRL